MNWRDKQLETEAKILEKVEITREELFWLRVDAGKAFLRKLSDSDRAAYEASPAFWNWWQQVWTAIDLDVISKLEDKADDFKWSYQLYSRFFQPEYIQYYPNKEVVTAVRQMQLELKAQEVPHE
jgi:hypothetical protein